MIIEQIAMILLILILIIVTVIAVIKIIDSDSISQWNGTPCWISQVSWVIGVISFIIGCICLIQESNNINGIFVLLGGIWGGIIYKLISYAILVGIYKIYIALKKGSYIAYEKGAKAIDSVGVAVVKKAQHITETAKEENKIEHEKQILKNRINDLELQKLKKRVAELEEELNKKE